MPVSRGCVHEVPWAGPAVDAGALGFRRGCVGRGKDSPRAPSREAERELRATRHGAKLSRAFPPLVLTKAAP